MKDVYGQKRQSFRPVGGEHATQSHRFLSRLLRSWAGQALTAAAPGVLLSSLPGIAAPAFQKGAEQFCIANLSAEQQSAYYSRILALGASYTHGCMACEDVRNWQGYTELTDDQFWVRRNYLAHFFSQTPWKNPNEFRFEKLYILENDGRTKPRALVTPSHLKTYGYTGEWLLDPSSGAFGFLSQTLKQRIESQDLFLAADAAKVGGSYLQKGKLEVRPGPRGILMRTVPGQYAALGAVPKSVYDLSVDGGFLGLIFSIHSDPEKVAALERTGWRDAALREQVVRAFAQRMSELDPTIVMAVDLLFWDTVFEAVHRLHEAGPTSPLVRLTLGIIGQTPIGKSMFDRERRENQRADMYRALGMVSVGMNGRPPVPVLLARLADNPIEKFRDKNYMPVIATIFGQFFEQVTGVNLISELLVWLNKLSLTQGGPGLRTATGDVVLPELGIKLSRSDIAELRKTLSNIQSQMPPTPEPTDSADGTGATGSPTLFGGEAPKQPRFSFDPVGGATVTLFPEFTQGIVGRLLVQALVDIPGFLNGLSQSFRSVNEQVAAVTRATDNNIHELDVNEFYENLGYFLNPRTAHPSVLGATRMARMVERTTCGGRAL